MTLCTRCFVDTPCRAQLARAHTVFDMHANMHRARLLAAPAAAACAALLGQRPAEARAGAGAPLASPTLYQVQRAFIAVAEAAAVDEADCAEGPESSRAEGPSGSTSTSTSRI